MARHVLTVEDSAKGGRNRGKIALRLQKMVKKELGMELDHETMIALIQQPAIIGTALFLLVEGIKSLKAGGSLSQKQPTFIQAWTQAFGNVLGINLANTPGSNVSGLFSNVGLDALQGALLVYIGTGGNPTGITSTLGKVAGGASAFLK